jgi:tellurite resistance protein
VGLVDRLSDATVIFAVMARYNSQGSAEAQRTFDQARAAVGASTVALDDAGDDTVARVDQALARLAELDRDSRRRFVAAAAAVAADDGFTSAEEAELLRVIAEAVGQPVPPLLPLPPEG